MKWKAKVLAFVFLIAIMGVTAYANSDMESTTGLLEGLNIISAEDKGAEGITTRAEFVTFVLRITDYKVSVPAEKPQFVDVAKTYPLYDDICRAYAAGLIKPDNQGRFNPDYPIMPADAARILLRALGYGEYIEDQNDTEIMTIARRKDLFKGISPSSSRPLEKQEVFTLLYNALHIDIAYFTGMKDGYPQYSVTENKTLLSDCFDVEYVEGVVTADKYGATIGSKCEKDSIVINSVEYELPENCRGDYLGMNVRCYWKEVDFVRVAVCIDTRYNTVAEFGFEDARCTNGSFSRNVKDKYTKMSTDKKTTVLINGCIADNTSAIENSIKDYAGSIKMVDNNRDGVYDVVIIKRYINARVESFDDVDNILKTEDGREYKLDEYENVYAEDTYRTRLNNVYYAAGEVVSIFEPLYGKDDITIVGTAKTEAVIAELHPSDGETIVKCDDDTEYKLSKSIIFDIDDISIGRAYSIYIDFEGRLAYIDESFAKELLGYLIAARLNAFGDELVFKVYGADGKIVELKAGDRFRLRSSDGLEYNYKNPSDIMKKMQQEGQTEGVPVMYRTNSGGEISRLYLATDDQSKVFHILKDDKTTITNDRYEYRNYSFSGKYVCTPSTLFMTVPMTKGEDEDYRIGSIGDFAAGSSYRFGQSYYLRNVAINVAVQPTDF